MVAKSGTRSRPSGRVVQDKPPRALTPTIRRNCARAMKYISDEELLHVARRPVPVGYAARPPARRRRPRAQQHSHSAHAVASRARARSQVAIDGDVLDISAFMTTTRAVRRSSPNCAAATRARCSSTWATRRRPDHAPPVRRGQAAGRPEVFWRRAPPCSPPRRGCSRRARRPPRAQRRRCDRRRRVHGGDLLARVAAHAVAATRCGWCTGRPMIKYFQSKIKS